jgi:hypothetical protein
MYALRRFLIENFPTHRAYKAALTLGWGAPLMLGDSLWDGVLPQVPNYCSSWDREQAIVF